MRTVCMTLGLLALLAVLSTARAVECRTCHGKGKVEATCPDCREGVQMCKNCTNGSGLVLVRNAAGKWSTQPCPECKLKGKPSQWQCPTCQGKRRILVPCSACSGKGELADPTRVEQLKKSLEHIEFRIKNYQKLVTEAEDAGDEKKAQQWRKSLEEFRARRTAVRIRLAYAEGKDGQLSAQEQVRAAEARVKAAEEELAAAKRALEEAKKVQPSEPEPQ